MNRYTTRQIRWLKDNFGYYPTNIALTSAFNKHFGTDIPYESLRFLILSQVGSRKYSKTQMEWVAKRLDHDPEMLTLAFNRRYGTNKPVRSIQYLVRRIRKEEKNERTQA